MTEKLIAVPVTKNCCSIYGLNSTKLLSVTIPDNTCGIRHTDGQSYILMCAHLQARIELGPANTVCPPNTFACYKSIFIQEEDMPIYARLRFEGKV